MCVSAVVVLGTRKGRRDIQECTPQKLGENGLLCGCLKGWRSCKMSSASSNEVCGPSGGCVSHKGEDLALLPVLRATNTG